MSADTRVSDDTVSASTPPPPRTRRQDPFRPEIQGLRAVAVLLVVLFHLWPHRLSGGYVGVDVFFVISGYLITAHIAREVAQTGSVRVTRFWARRIRRLLPASLLVLAVSAVGVALLVPATLWAQSARQLGASALYVQNWALAFDSVDYMAADNVPTVAQHYWSLSVEEQFYLVWPLLVLALVALFARGSRTGPDGAVRRHVSPVRLRQVLVSGIGLVALASLTWSTWSTAQDQPFAYMSTLTRAWEFAAGALAALIVLREPWPEWARSVVGWLGGIAIVGSAYLYTESSLFPGWIALAPVLGTVAVIAAGRGRGWTSPGEWLSLPPARFIGDISYSVYLWHWPLIVVVPYATGRPLNLLDKVAILLVTIGLAWASKVLVEDPARTRPLLAAAPWRAFAFAVAGMLVLVSAGVGLNVELDRRERAAEVAAATQLDQAERCTGPGSLDTSADCGPVMGTGPLVVPPEVVAQQNSDPLFPQCQSPLDSDSVKSCEIGSTSRDPERTVAVIGDSHATHWFSALDELGRERNWKVVTFTKSSCPLTDARRVLPDEQTDDVAVKCDRWVDAVQGAVQDDPEISDVFVSAYSSAYSWQARPGEDLADPGVDGFAQVWSRLSQAGHRVFVLADVPRTTGENVPNCLAEHPDDFSRCTVPREQALPGDVQAAAVEAAADPNVRLIDLTDSFCDDSTCYPVVGGVVAYRDYSHLSAEYAQLLAPRIGAAVDAAPAAGG